MARGREIVAELRELRSLLDRRRFLGRAATLGLGASVATNGLGLRRADVGAADVQPADSLWPRATGVVDGTPEVPSGLKIGVGVAYLSLPFYANFQTGLVDGAARFGFELVLRDGQSNSALELANVEDFIAEGVAAILLNPTLDGAIPAISKANDADIPVIEVTNQVGFESGQVDVVTFVGTDYVELGRLQAQLVHDTFGDASVRIGYVQGVSGASFTLLVSQGFDEAIAQWANYTVVDRVTYDFDSDKALTVTQDLLTRFPKGKLDVIVIQGSEGVAAADFASTSGRDEVKFVLGGYPDDVRQAIIDGYVLGTVNVDPYTQAFEAMHMAWLYLNGRESEIPKPNFVPLPIITAENAREVPPAFTSSPVPRPTPRPQTDCPVGWEKCDGECFNPDTHICIWVPG